MLAGMIRAHQRQTCKACGRPDKFDFHVPDKVWAAVVPPELANPASRTANFKLRHYLDVVALDKILPHRVMADMGQMNSCAQAPNTTSISCVLRSGGDFRPKHVARLRDQAVQHAPAGTRFVCLTDQVAAVKRLGIEAIPLTADWPGWWAKIEALSLPGPNLQLDLDVSVIGDLSPVLDAAARCRMIGIYSPRPEVRFNSSVMGWRGDMSWLRAKFEEDPARYMETYKANLCSPSTYGDQAFIRDHCGQPVRYWYRTAPHRVVDYWRIGSPESPEAVSNTRPEAAIVVFYNRRHRPWRVGW